MSSAAVTPVPVQRSHRDQYKTVPLSAPRVSDEDRDRVLDVLNGRISVWGPR